MNKFLVPDPLEFEKLEKERVREGYKENRS